MRCNYYLIRYVRDVRGETGIDIAALAVSDSQPGRIALRRTPSFAPVLEFDADADVDLLGSFLSELPANVQIDSRYLDRAVHWENSIRVLPPREFVTSDFEGTFSLLADAEFGS